ncbi:6778_t:CDS:2, partial [Gigaspora margarita]
PDELDNPNLTDFLYPLDTKNKILDFYKILLKPYPIEQEWKVIADGSTNIVV